MSERLRLWLERDRRGAGYHLRDAATGERVGWEDPRLRVIAVEQYGCSVIKRMSQHRRRMYPLEAIVRERKRREEGRTDSERMYRRAEIVAKPQQRQFHRARGAARLWLSFENINEQASLGQDNRGGESIGACANDGGAAIRILDIISQFRHSSALRLL